MGRVGWCATCHKKGVIHGEGADEKFYCTKGCGAVYSLDSKDEREYVVCTGRR